MDSPPASKSQPTPGPSREGINSMSEANNIDKAITKIKNYIGQLSSPSHVGEGDRRG